MKKKIALVLALLLALSLPAALSSCSTPEQDTGPRTFVDSAGRSVELPAVIDKVAVSGSLAQIFVFPIAADKMVGLAGEWSEAQKPYIDAKYQSLPVIGQFYGQNDLNLEELTALGPQVIIDCGERKSTIAEDMDDIQQTTGIPTVYIEANFDDLDKTYELLGELLVEQDAAEELAAYCKNVNTKLSEGMAAVGSERASLLYITGQTGTNVIAEGSYHAQMLNFIADNVAKVENAVSSGSGNEVSPEQILNWNPDVIIFAPDSMYDSAASDPVFSQLRAIQAGRYYEAPSGPYNWLGFPPSVNRYLGAVWLAETLYPDVFDFDVKALTQEYYQKFYRTTLTDEQYAILTENSAVQ